MTTYRLPVNELRERRGFTPNVTFHAGYVPSEPANSDGPGKADPLADAFARGREEGRAEAMAEAAAQRLHNTPTIARNSYIHPQVIDLCQNPQDLPDPPDIDDMTQAERGLLAFLRSTA